MALLGRIREVQDVASVFFLIHIARSRISGSAHRFIPNRTSALNPLIDGAVDYYIHRLHGHANGGAALATIRAVSTRAARAPREAHI